MKGIYTLFLALLLSLSAAVAQNAPATPARSDIYYVHFAKATLGKAAQMGDFLKTPNPNSPMPEHRIVLRHEDGDSWDYVSISHMGAKATVEPSGTPAPAAARDTYDWHTDTYVNGPPWPEFARALGLGEAAGKTAGAVYVVSIYRYAPGHRDQLEKNLSASPSAGDPIAGQVLMQHLDGAAWNYLAVVRYNSWEDYATGQKNTMPKGNSGPWFSLRDHASFHTDTLADRIAP
ncbi:MAG: hypothetical protein WA463_04335 [Terriglobales bacterium]